MKCTLYTFVQNLLFLSLAVLLSTQLAIAAYKPVDISDIKGEQRKELMDAKLGIASMPNAARDAFFCEQLGLCFKKDGGQAMFDYNGYSAIKDDSISCFVGRSGRPEIWRKAYSQADVLQWDRSLSDVKKFKRDAVIGLFKNEVERCILNTAKYLLKTMPEEERWMLLASMGNMLYNEKETSFSRRNNSTMDCGINISLAVIEGRGYSYLDPAGREHDIRAYLSDGARAWRYWRWRQIVWRCENLVGSKDILALFPDEVKAMRKAYKQRLAGIAKKAEEAKMEQEARNEALVNAADEMLKELSPAQRRAWMAEHLGFCYTNDGRPAYQSARTANNDALFVDADGKERKLSEVANKSDEKWVAATNAVVAVNYSGQLFANRKDELEDLAEKTAHVILASMPAAYRQQFFAENNRLFFLPDGREVFRDAERRAFKLESGVTMYYLQAYEAPLFYNVDGKMTQCFSRVTQEWRRWNNRWHLLFLCENIIGIEPINAGFGDEVNAMRRYYEKSPFCKKK